MIVTTVRRYGRLNWINIHKIIIGMLHQQVLNLSHGFTICYMLAKAQQLHIVIAKGEINRPCQSLSIFASQFWHKNQTYLIEHIDYWTYPQSDTQQTRRYETSKKMHNQGHIAVCW